MCDPRMGDHCRPPWMEGHHHHGPPGMGGHCGPSPPPPPWFGPKFDHHRHHMFHQMRQMWGAFVPYELEESHTEYIITMPLPGFDLNEIDVSVKENTILVEAQKPEAPEAPKEPQNRKIWSFGAFLWKRSNIATKIALPEKIKPDSVKAKLAKGILTITVEKIPGTKVPIET
ncbi:MAG: Hsp20/alpha crystallin family protein [Candidatus Helarchaeota archaeon]|nr:Hsp20/alpha crystallin family protein [Candidatus Helarchaeota archaeon]